jgi:hypothetical protein
MTSRFAKKKFIKIILSKGPSINDVTQIWIIFDTPSPPIVTLFITKALVMMSQNL